MVGASKGALTQLTFEGALSRMFTVMAGELVRPGKLPAAALPAAVVGFLTSVGTEVSLEVRALGVHLLAILIGAGVDDGALLGPGASAPAHSSTRSCKRK